VRQRRGALYGASLPSVTTEKHLCNLRIFYQKLDASMSSAIAILPALGMHELILEAWSAKAAGM
jgi:hypothetical protein